MSRTPRVLSSAFLLVLVAGCAGRQAARPADGGAFLWELRKGGKTMFLTGSVHLGKQGQMALTPSMRAALQKSDAVVLEADPAKMEQQGLGMMMAQLGMLSPDKDLFSMLEPADAETLATRAAAANLPREAVARMKPWLAAMLLSIGGMTQAGYEAQGGTESLVLQTLGDPRTKPVLELEGGEAQIRMLAAIPDDVGRLMLVEELRRDEPVGDSIERLAQRWREGDADGLARALFEDLAKPEFQPLYRALFVDRNVLMAARMAELIEDGKTYFVVVGAGHVVGEDGLLKLLGDRGFSVRQLPKQ